MHSDTALRSLTVPITESTILCLVIVNLGSICECKSLLVVRRTSWEACVPIQQWSILAWECVFSEPGRGARQIDRDNEWERGLSIPNSGFVRVIGPCIREGPPDFNGSTDIYYCTATSIISKGLGFGIRAGSEREKKGKREKDISGKCAGGNDLTLEVSANMFCSGMFCNL